ncbi:flippase [Mucilaginibacter ginkgonis]|uniref:Flippase n=1 Tax=Mucilaginibacter ginkgonis TaxID=2682091 RepID=A0A6I4I6J8_9SPHI|nr:flippase [Mucilaginibacter ginkgonis]QQL50865.1 flippase [Mucilaginibacter ginkgonis]
MTVVKNYFFNLIFTLANVLFPIVSFPYVSRILGPAGIGKVQFAFSFALYFCMLAAIGIPIYGAKEVARHRDDPAGRAKVFSELVTIYFISSIIFSTCYFLIISFVPYFTGDPLTYRAAGILVFTSFCSVEWIYTGMEDFKSIALRSVAFKLLNLILLFMLVKTPADFRVYLYLMMFAFIGNNLLSIFLLKGKVKLSFTNLKLRHHITPLLYIFATTLAGSMYAEMDTVLLGFLSNSKTVGLYTAAVKFSKISIPFVTSMGVILLPKAGKDFADRNLESVQRSLDQTFKFLVFFSVPLVIGLIMLAPELISLFSGREFLPAAQGMRILALLPLIIGFAHMLLFMVMVPAGLNRAMFFCVLSGVAVSVLLNFLLVPRYQATGCAVANICAEIAVSGLYFHIIRQRYAFKYNWVLIPQALLSAALFVPIIWAIKEAHIIPIGIIICAAVSCAVVYITTQTWVFKNRLAYQFFALAKSKLNISA